ncbi:helix-turn-helix domain-containing protein [Saprospira grandis]|uniref:helix-turn-helix domain-containing protein n=1 Tax=Saprospira grandis TaxID=1008 RepID=UPI0006884856|nr:helix-turn-helix transcriptional regulator [Saprospira grandis]
MQESYRVDIGKILRDARKKKGLTQEQLAQKVGKKRSYISRIEGGLGNNINVKTLIDVVENGLDGQLKVTFII